MVFSLESRPISVVNIPSFIEKTTTKIRWPRMGEASQDPKKSGVDFMVNYLR